MAECHPVGFQWVVEARNRGAKVIHVDPRFTRTSALCDLHVPLRAGADIAFLGGLVNYVLEHGRWFDEYVRHFTNASAIVDERFADTEDLDGLFSGWDPEQRAYDTASWQLEGTGTWDAGGGGEATEGGGAPRSDWLGGDRPREDPTLQHPRCVFQILRRHFRRYTPEMVERICGVPQRTFLEVARTLCDNSGRERTSAFVYSVGWTQHTVGVQYIRTAAILQLLLGNIGRPGGGIMALRGHASIQGSTDIPTLYNILPGYLPMPDAGTDGSIADYVARCTPPTGYWGHADAYLVSLLKAWWGDAAVPENEWCFGYLPRIDGDHSTYPTMLRMRAGAVKGFFLLGENPAVGSANARLHRLAMAQLEWLVVRDLQEVESASFWYDAPEIETGELRTEEIPTEVFFLPAAAHTEKSGSFTNTQRLLQWHHEAVPARGDCRSELWFMYHLGRRVRERLARSRENRDRPVLDLTWNYPTRGPHEEPDAEAVLREINGRDAHDRPLSSYLELRADGSTSCGCWIYGGCFAGGVNQPARRTPAGDQSWVGSEWGWAWPLNRRILYNRASADPQGRPWSERKRYVWWDTDARRWTGEDVPDFKVDLAPGYEPPPGARAEDALRGDAPFVMQADGRGWLFAPAGVIDGPLPTHYEPHESPFPNPLYGQRANPARTPHPHPDNPFNPSAGQDGASVFPYVITSYRLTEHHTAGAMSRTLPYLAELQPEMFCEVSPALADERGLVHGGWATIVTSRAAIEARVLVTDRIKPLEADGRTVHQVGVPYHWGARGLATGDPANDLFHLALDPNVHIQEVKAATCDIRPGRRPRGEALMRLVADYRQRAESREQR